jgi:hypothetical protein
MLIPAIVILLVIVIAIAIVNKCSNKMKWTNTK